MAFPNAIKEIGALSIQDDIFEYFKGGLLENSTVNREEWPYHTGSGDNFARGITFPFTRQQFYTWCDAWTVTTDSSDSTVNSILYYFRTIHGTRLYAFSEVQGNTNFPVEAVKHWGKIKALEYSFFGSVGNGGDLTATTDVGTGNWATVIPTLKRYDFNYLRYGLVKFPSYGACHPEAVLYDPLTNMTQNVATRRIDFTLPSGILIPDTERSLTYGNTWGTITEKPMIVPAGNYPPGAIQLRVKKSKGAYIEESDTIQNTVTFP